MIYILLIIGVVFGFNVFVYMLGTKIKKLENKILSLFRIRSNLIPALFELTKDSIIHIDDVFREVLYLRELEISHFGNKKLFDFDDILVQQAHIHHELDFIFKICTKHPKLEKKGKYLYIREMILETSENIGNLVEIHNKIIRSHNILQILSILLIVGLIFPNPLGN